MDKDKKKEYNRKYREKQKLSKKVTHYDLEESKDILSSDKSDISDNNEENNMDNTDINDIAIQKYINEKIQAGISKYKQSQKNENPPKSMIRETLQHSINSIIGGLIMSAPILIQFMMKPQAIKKSSRDTNQQNYSNTLNQSQEPSLFDINSLSTTY